MAPLNPHTDMQSRPNIMPKPTPWTDTELDAVEANYPDGMSVQEVVEAFAARGASLTEATFRKYVQVGLLPRSVRVGRKGKHRGSKGLYPSTAIRQIAHIRRLMRQGYTMEEIRREFLFVRGDIHALSRQLNYVYTAFEDTIDARATRIDEYSVKQMLKDAREMGNALIGQLESMEKQLTMSAKMANAKV